MDFLFVVLCVAGWGVGFGTAVGGVGRVGGVYVRECKFFSVGTPVSSGPGVGEELGGVRVAMSVVSMVGPWEGWCAATVGVQFFLRI